MSNVTSLTHPGFERNFPLERFSLSDVPTRSLTLAEIIRYGFPGRNMSKEVRQWKTRNIPNLMRGVWRIIAARKLGIPGLHGQLCLAVIAPDGHRVDYGLVSMRMITSSGADYVTDAFQGLVGLSDLKYHGLGGGAGPETVSDTALGSEFSAEYTPINTRAAGIASEGQGSNFYRSLAFTTVTNTVTIAEHGIFNQAATGGGTLLDRSAIASQTIFANFTVQTDYRLETVTGT